MWKPLCVHIVCMLVTMLQFVKPCWSIFFLTFDSDNAISQEATMHEITVLQLSAVVGNWLIHGCHFVFCVKLCLLQSILLSFFLLNKTFLHFFLFTKCTIVFWDLSLSGLPNLWQASIPSLLTKTSVSAKTGITYSSKISSETDSGIPLDTTLFRQPYCAKALWPNKHGYLLTINVFCAKSLYAFT